MALGQNVLPLLMLLMLTGDPLGKTATLVLLKKLAVQFGPPGPITKKPKASLKTVLTNSGYSSEPNTNCSVNDWQCGITSNSSLQISRVALGSIVESCGSG